MVRLSRDRDRSGIPLARTRTRSVSTRLKNAAIFVGLVWALAASFVGLELLALFAGGVVANNPGSFGNLALMRATQESTACEVLTDERGETSAAMSPALAQAPAWLLGVNVGQEAQWRQRTSAGAREAASAAAVNIAQLTTLLAVPPPGTFTAEEWPNANTEFLSFVERDDRQTAHRLAVAYSPQACRLYKLGAFWGYAMMPRNIPEMGGEAPIFHVELDHYAREAGLPESLWKPMVAPTSRDATGPELATDTLAITQAVTKHLTGTH